MGRSPLLPPPSATAMGADATSRVCGGSISPLLPIPFGRPHSVTLLRFATPDVALGPAHDVL